MMGIPLAKTIALIYGLAAYAISLTTFLYAIGFVGNIVVAKSVDDGPQEAYVESLLINLGLLFLFALQHSVMARKGCKAWWTRAIPQPVERSTGVLVSSLVLLLLYWQWRPIPTVIWEFGNPGVQTVLEILFWIGWLIALHSSFLIDHGDLFGLRHIRLYARGQPYTPVKFQMPDLYRYVRHPIMMGILIALWSTPVMTLGHLLFAIFSTAHILLSIRQEERELLELYGEAYREYRRRVPMLIPLLTVRMKDKG